MTHAEHDHDARSEHKAHSEHEHAHEDDTLQQWLKTAILFGLGLYFVYNVASGNLTNYINERFAWLSWVAAPLFVLLGAISAYSLLTRREEDHGEQGSHTHDHGALSWPVLAVVALPLVFGTLLPSRPLGASAVEGDLTAGAGLIGGDEAATVERDPLDWNVLDWLRAVNRSTDLTEFDGQEANLLGFVYRNDQFPAGHFVVTRFIISCCVADATAVGMPVNWPEADGLDNDAWVQVHGTFELGEFAGNLFPVLQADALEIVPEPEHPYLYP
jgi:putative membrane protein